MRLAEPAVPMEKQLEAAIRLLESNVDFPRVQVEMSDRLQTARSNAPPEAGVYGSKARLIYVLQRLDIRAQAFLGLVSDISLQNAYIAILDSFVFEAWDEFIGWPFQVMRPASDQAKEDLGSIRGRAVAWAQTGYRRLANPYQEQAPTLGDSAPESPVQAGTQEVASPVAAKRRAMVDAYQAEVLRKTGKKLTRAAIWRAAGYRARSEFERWERNDSKYPNQEAHRRITTVLTDKPHLKKN